MSKLSHLDDTGAAHMVDVSDKQTSARQATAEAMVRMSPEAYEAAIEGTGPKGEVLATARIAGIMAAKKTSELIPLCHPLPLAQATIEFEPRPGSHALRIVATAKTVAQTGVEMEALTAVAVAALTVYDMVKAVDKAVVIDSIRLLTKSGGKSGLYAAREKKEAPAPKPASMKTAVRAVPKTLMGEVAAPPAGGDPNAAREAFRAFMIGHRLRATVWAKEAGVPAAQVYAFLTGRTRALGAETAQKLARAARVAVDDMFRPAR